MRVSNGILAVSVALGALVLTVPKPAGAKNASGETVTAVEANHVCMIEKKYFEDPQEPVTIDDRTYYVCCRMCATPLLEDPANRKDIDPMSGREVEKSSAIVGVSAAGRVYFFENAENLKQFRVPVESVDPEPFHAARACHPRR